MSRMFLGNFLVHIGLCITLKGQRLLTAQLLYIKHRSANYGKYDVISMALETAVITRVVIVCMSVIQP